MLVSGALGEAENGGPQVNIVPKAGGNRFQGSAFYSDAGTWSTGNNLNPTLISYGLTQPAGVISSWDASGSGGGPIKRDRLWFFVNARKYSTIAPVPGAFANLNAGDATQVDVREKSQRGNAIRRLQKHLLGPAHRSGDAEEPRVVLPRVPVPVFGLDAVTDRRGLPHVRIRLDRRREPHIVAGVVPRLPPFSLQRDAGDLAVAADEQAAPRSGVLALPVPVGRVRTGPAGRRHEPDSGAGAVGHLRPAAVLLSRAVRSAGLCLCRQRRQPQQLEDDRRRT